MANTSLFIKKMNDYEDKLGKNGLIDMLDNSL